MKKNRKAIIEVIGGSGKVFKIVICEKVKMEGSEQKMGISRKGGHSYHRVLI